MSRDGFQVGPKDDRTPSTCSCFHESVDRPALPAVPGERFDCDIEPDLVPVLERIGYRFRGGGDLHRYAFERVAVDPVGESGPRKAHDTNGRPVEGGLASLHAERKPHLVWALRRELVKLERREEAHDARRHMKGCLDERVVLSCFGALHAIKSAPEALYDPLLDKSLSQ